MDVFEKHCRKEDDPEIWESIYGGEGEQAIENYTGETRIWLKSLVNLSVMMRVQQVRPSVENTVHSLCLVMLQQQITSIQQGGTTCQDSLPFLKYLEISIALGILKNVMPKHRDLEAYIMQLIRF